MTESTTKILDVKHQLSMMLFLPMPVSMALLAMISGLLFFLIAQMIVPDSIYWNLGIGRNAGDVEKDGKESV